MKKVIADVGKVDTISLDDAPDTKLYIARYGAHYYTLRQSLGTAYPPQGWQFGRLDEDGCWCGLSRFASSPKSLIFESANEYPFFREIYLADNLKEYYQFLADHS